MRLPDKQRNEMENTSATNDNDSGKFGAKNIAMIVGAMVVGGLVVALFLTAGNEDKKEHPPVTAVVEQKEDSAQKETTPAPPPVPKADKDEPKNYYENGQYKVGADIPAGEYIAVGTGRMELAADSLGQSSSVIYSDNISESRRYVEARDGEYLRISGKLRLYHAKDAPKVDTSEKVPAGEYKVGVDIPAGEYKISSEDRGYAEVTKLARGWKNSNIVTNKSMQDGDMLYITVKDGQYFFIKNAEARLVQ